jgi:hypothetical protein
MRYRRIALQARVSLRTGCIALIIASGNLQQAPVHAAHPVQAGWWLVCAGSLAQTGGEPNSFCVRPAVRSKAPTSPEPRR